MAGEKNLSDVLIDEDAVAVKQTYESNADTNAYTDVEKGKVGNISVSQAVDLDAMDDIVSTPSVADRSVLSSTIGTIVGQAIYQSDINLTYTWKDTGVADNGGTQIEVPAASGAGWYHEPIFGLNVRWFGALGDGSDATTAFQKTVAFAEIGLTDVLKGVHIVVPKGLYKISDATILKRRGYKFVGEGRATQIFIDVDNFPTTNKGIFQSLEIDRTYLETTSFSFRDIAFYGYDPRGAMPVTPVPEALAIFASGVSSSAFPTDISNCYFKGFDVAIGGAAWWQVTIAQNVFRYTKGTGIGIKFAPTFTRDTSYNGGTAVNTVKIKGNWLNSLKYGLQTGDQGVHGNIYSENAIEQVEKGYYGFNSNGFIMDYNYIEATDAPFEIGFSSNTAPKVDNFSYKNNNLSGLCGTSAIKNTINSTFKDNVNNTTSPEFTFHNGGGTNDTINCIVEYTDSIAYLVDIDNSLNIIYPKEDNITTGGGVIESGDVVDKGHYTKYSDGTLVCTRRVELDLTITTNQVFGWAHDFYPSQASIDIIKQFSVSGTAAQRTEYRKTTGLMFVTDSFWTLSIGVVGGATGVADVFLTATGKWKA